MEPASPARCRISVGNACNPAGPVERESGFGADSACTPLNCREPARYGTVYQRSGVVALGPDRSAAWNAPGRVMSLRLAPRRVPPDQTFRAPIPSKPPLEAP